MHDYVEATGLRECELGVVNAGEADVLPGGGAVSLFIEGLHKLMKIFDSFGCPQCIC